MKKTKLLSIAAVFAILTAIFCVTTFAQENTLTLYIDQSTAVAANEQDGSREKPYSTTAAAQTYAAGQSADTIVFHLLSNYNAVSGGSGYIGIAGKTVKITADSNTTVFQHNSGSINQLKGDVIFDNVTVGKGCTGDDINLKGNNLTFTENVVINDQNISINQAWNGDIAVNNQVVDIRSTNWKLLNVNLANNSGGTITGTSTVKVSGNTTIQSLGLTKNTNFNGTQNYIIGATVRDLYLGVESAQKGKRYVQINGGGVIDGYTTGDATGLTADDFSGVNIIEINSGMFNKSGNGTAGGSAATEPTNFKKINVNPNNPEAWANVTRVVIFNDNKLTDVEVTDTAAIVLRVAEGGHATAVTTEPTEANGWDCELLGFEIALPTGMEYVYIDGELAEDENGRYVIDEAGEHTVTFGRDYTVTFGEDSTQYAPGTVINLPEAPAHDNAEHYTFQWSDGENTYAAGAEYTVNGDVTFTEVWTAKSYTVKFMNGEDTVSEATLAYGVEITAPEDPTAPEGQVFDGWYNGETKFVEGTTVTGAVTYVARFCYTVTFGEATTNYAPGAVITLPAAPAHDNAEHYTFQWSDGTNTYDAGAQYTVNASVTFTEAWTAKTYTVKFMNGENPVSEATLAYGAEITAPADPTAPEGQVFDGWYNGETKFVAGTTVTGNVTYVARFGAIKYAINVIADLAAGGTVTGAGQYEYNEEVTLTATAKFGYAFDGWYVGEDKVSDVAEYTITVTEAKEYTAKFVVAAVEIEGSLVLAREGTSYYNVRYDVDGKVTEDEDAAVYTYNNAAKITVYDCEDAIFEGTEDEFKFEAELGTYRVVIKKNGYLTYDEEITIATGEELSDIELVPGDIKADYDDACGDGVIDIDDFIRVLRGFSEEESSDRLRHAVDIDENGSVNVTDLAYIKTAMSENE